MEVRKIEINNVNNVIPFGIIKGKENQVKYNKDGSIRKTVRNKQEGESSEVYPLDMEEIKLMIDMFDKKIEQASDKEKLQIAERNKLLFIVGCNLGIRASDLIKIKWSFFYEEQNGELIFRDGYKIKPEKTRKTNKFVTLYFNQAIKNIVSSYMEKYNCGLDEYVFASRKGDSHITAISLGRIIKDTAKERGIKKNICSHTLRKTFGLACYNSTENKTSALTLLQAIFNHSSSNVTLRYIGITLDDISEMFNGINIGL